MSQNWLYPGLPSYRHSILLKLKILTYSTLIFNLIGYIFQNGYFEISLRFFLLN